MIGRDGKQVLVRHGGTYVRVHICSLTQRDNNSDAINKRVYGDKAEVREEKLDVFEDCDDESVVEEPSEEMVPSDTETMARQR